VLSAAVIGLGTIGRHHARVLQASPRVRVVGAVDPAGDVFAAVDAAVPVFAAVEELLSA
jgi:predicted dehydrogenase